MFKNLEKKSLEIWGDNFEKAKESSTHKMQRMIVCNTAFRLFLRGQIAVTDYVKISEANNEKAF